MTEIEPKSSSSDTKRRKYTNGSVGTLNESQIVGESSDTQYDKDKDNGEGEYLICAPSAP